MTKKFTLLLAVLMATISYGQNLITYGDFEDLTAPADITVTAGTDYWYTTNQAGSPRAAVATDGSNNYGVLKNISGLARLYYKFNVVSGTTYKLTLKVADQTDNDKELVVTVRSGSTQLLAFVPGSQSNGDDVVRDGDGTNTAFAIAFATMDATLTEHSVNFTANDTQEVAIWFQKSKTTSTGGEVYLDDVVFEVDATASIEDLKKFNFSFAPNPAKDQLRLSAVNPINEVKVFNMLGQEVLRRSYNEREAFINVSNLIEGVYVMKVNIGDSVGTFRIIKE